MFYTHTHTLSVHTYVYTYTHMPSPYTHTYTTVTQTKIWTMCKGQALKCEDLIILKIYSTKFQVTKSKV